MTIDSIRNVAVVGLGTMGHGIAQTFAMAGLHVQAYDEAATARDSVHDRIRQNLKSFVAAGLVRSEEIDPVLSRVRVVASEREAVAGAQFVTEAVAEDLAVKQELLARLERLVHDEAILASNSSTFPISQSAVKLQRPDRAIVTHWFNPPHIVPAVEVVPSPKTSEATTRTTLALMGRIGKKAIRINKEIPGFVVNRLQIALTREVWNLLDQGVASAEDIDAAICASMGFRLAVIGQLEVSDFGGIDIQARVYRNLAPEIRSDATIPATVERLLDAGHFGVKTGKGFYEYTPQTIVERRSRRDRLFLALLKLLHERDPSTYQRGAA